MRKLNESAIKEHALACSKQFRNGKFTRVGSDFLEEVEADIEAYVRVIEPPTGSDEPALPTAATFTTGALLDVVQEKFNLRIARMIQRKVQAQPSVGCTLGRTR